jgi:hypothetical protein
LGEGVVGRLLDEVVIVEDPPELAGDGLLQLFGGEPVVCAVLGSVAVAREARVVRVSA